MQKVGLFDFQQHRYPSLLRLSPDERYLAYVLRSVDAQRDRYCHDLWLYDTRTGENRRLTFGEEQSFFLWDDDTHVLFFEREKRSVFGVEADETRVIALDVESGEHEVRMTLPWQLTSMAKMGGGYGFLARTNLNEENILLLSEPEQRKCAAERKHNAGFKLVTEVPMTENGTGIVSGDRTSLFVCTGEGDWRMVTPPDFDVNHAVFSEKEILFTAFPFTGVRKLTEGFYRYEAEGDRIVTLIPDDIYSIDYVDFWKDGALCLALEMDDYGVYEHPTFFRVDRGGKLTRLLRYDLRVTEAVVFDTFAGSATEQQVLDDRLYFLTTEGLNAGLRAYDEETGFTDVVGGERSLLDFALGREKLFFVAFEGQYLPEIYAWEQGQSRRITHFNDPLTEERCLSTPEHFRFTDRAGVEIDGFVMKPTDYEPGRSYPAILHIHGGPKMIFNTVYHNEMQFWAGQGYFVCYCNPRGSCGRGNEFAELRSRLGTVDFEDLMDFTDECLRRYPEIDEKRFGVVGGSYGGFMTNWVIGHTGRFACAVSQRSISDYHVDYLISDIGYWFTPDQHGATIWEDDARLWNDSPLKYATDVTTPTLFIHSDLDYRCPLVNGLEMFAALKLHGVETQMCMFYGEDHGLSRTGRPSNRVCRMEQILRWLDSHLKEKA